MYAAGPASPLSPVTPHLPAYSATSAFRPFSSETPLNGWEHCQGEHILGLDLNWVRDWSVEKALTELVQNFCDAATQLSQKRGLHGCLSLSPPWFENGLELRRVSCQDQVLGGIVWNKELATLALINQDTFLPTNALTIGYSSKSSGKYLGKHGEGLKGAIVTLLRNQKTIEIHQSGCALRFGVKLPGTTIGLQVTTTQGDEHIKTLQSYFRMRNVDRTKDVIVVVKGVPTGLSVLNQFIQYSHIEVPRFADLATTHTVSIVDNSKYYFRLKSEHGDILWQSETTKGKPGDLRNCIYVGGLFWIKEEGIDKYGLDFKPQHFENRDRSYVNAHVLKKQVALIVDAVIREHQFFLEVILQELENAHHVTSVPHLHKLEDLLSQESCFLLAQKFRGKPENAGKPFIIMKEEEEDLKRFVDVKLLCAITSRFLCLLFRKKGQAPTIAQIQEFSKRKLLAAPRCEIPWNLKCRQAIESAFHSEIWKLLVMHQTENALDVPECLFHRADDLIHLSMRLKNKDDFPYNIIKVIGKAWEERDAERKPQDVKPTPTSSSSSSSPSSSSSSTTNLTSHRTSSMSMSHVPHDLGGGHGQGSDSLSGQGSDGHEQQIDRTQPPGDWLANLSRDVFAMSQTVSVVDELTLPAGQFFTLDKAEGISVLCASSDVAQKLVLALCQIQQLIPNYLVLIKRIAEEVLKAIGWQKGCEFCYTLAPFHGYALVEQKRVFVNLWGLLHPSARRPKEVLIFLVWILAHEVAHVLLPPREKHSSRHGRLTEELMTKALLNIKWEHFV
jgi:hypothetical protein